MPTYRPAGEDAPMAMLAQAAEERRSVRMLRKKAGGGPGNVYQDPIRRGWPGPRQLWTPAMEAVFDRAFMRAKHRGLADPRAFAEGYGAVVLMPEGRVR